MLVNVSNKFHPLITGFFLLLSSFCCAGDKTRGFAQVLIDCLFKVYWWIKNFFEADSTVKKKIEIIPGFQFKDSQEYLYYDVEFSSVLK